MCLSSESKLYLNKQTRSNYCKLPTTRKHSLVQTTTAETPVKDRSKTTIFPATVFTLSNVIGWRYSWRGRVDREGSLYHHSFPSTDKVINKLRISTEVCSFDFRFPTEGELSFLLQLLQLNQTGSGYHLASHPVRTGRFFGGKASRTRSCLLNCI